MERSFWILHRNKIMAIAFCGLGIGTYIGQLIFLGVVYGWTGVFAGPWAYFNILITSVVYVMLLITNNQNDNRAYQAISLLVFFQVYDAIWTFLPIGSNFVGYFFGAFPSWLFGVLLANTALMVIGAGVVMYIFLLRYRMMRGTYKRLWLWALLLLVAMVLDAIAIAVASFVLIGWSPLLLAEQLLVSLPDIFMIVACLFTIRRLRRF